MTTDFFSCTLKNILCLTLLSLTTSPDVFSITPRGEGIDDITLPAARNETNTVDENRDPNSPPPVRSVLKSRSSSSLPIRPRSPIIITPLPHASSNSSPERIGPIVPRLPLADFYQEGNADRLSTLEKENKELKEENASLKKFQPTGRTGSFDSEW